MDVVVQDPSPKKSDWIKCTIKIDHYQLIQQKPCPAIVIIILLCYELTIEISLLKSGNCFPFHETNKPGYEEA
jgi:hypothetical protein